MARSRDPGLHGRKPVFATPRALALSYFEGYVDFTGRIKAYGVVDLRVARSVRLAAVEERMCGRSSSSCSTGRIAASRPPTRAQSGCGGRYRAFRDAHGYKPWKYYSGRDRWTPLPPEFRDRG